MTSRISTQNTSQYDECLTNYLLDNQLDIQLFSSEKYRNYAITHDFPLNEDSKTYKRFVLWLTDSIVGYHFNEGKKNGRNLNINNVADDYLDLIRHAKLGGVELQ